VRTAGGLRFVSIEESLEPGRNVCSGCVSGIEVSDSVVDPVLEILTSRTPSFDERLLDRGENEGVGGALSNEYRRFDV